MTELLQAVERLRNAIENEGNHPEYHRKMWATLREEWPTLTSAIDAILAASSEGTP